MKFPTSYTIETRRCRLRIVSLEDIPHIFSATRHKGFNDGMLWDPPSCVEELSAAFEASMRAWTEDQAYCFTIEEREQRKFIGRIAIRSKEGSVWDIGFWTHPEEQNKGYMKEALAAVVTFGFTELDATRLVACHASWNQASEAVLRSTGMIFLEHIPEGFQKRGEWVAENLLGITREEWESNKTMESAFSGTSEK